MDWSSNSLNEAQVNAVAGTERTGAYEKGNAGQWQRLQAARRRRALLYRLANVLARADFAEARRIMHALGEDDFFLSSTVVHHFVALETAVAAADAPTAREALVQLVRPAPESSVEASEKTRAGDRHASESESFEPLPKDELDDHGSLDVTA
jgi:hypothetical protein